jgi:hypothetical protein
MASSLPHERSASGRRSPIEIRRIFRAALGDTEFSPPSSPFPALTLTPEADTAKRCASILNQLRELFFGISAPVSRSQLLDMLG